MRRTCPGRTLGLAMFAALAIPLSAFAQTTAWIGTIGDWGSAANWSDGEPTAGVDADISIASTPTVTQAGEVCRNLTLVVSVGGATVRVQSGSLTVADRLQLASTSSGVFAQSGGTVSAGELIIANPGAGAFTLSGGTLTLGRAWIGSTGPGTSGSFTQTLASPSCTISDSLVVAPSGSFHCAAGTLEVGSTNDDGVFVEGVFAMSNNPTIATTGFTMSESATLSVFIGAAGVATIQASAAIGLAGQLQVTDIGASDGTYEIMTGGSVQGAFSSAFLPPDWSWRVVGTSVLLSRGHVEVMPSSWSRVKAGFAG